MSTPKWCFIPQYPSSELIRISSSSWMVQDLGFLLVPCGATECLNICKMIKQSIRITNKKSFIHIWVWFGVASLEPNPDQPFIEHNSTQLICLIVGLLRIRQSKSHDVHAEYASSENMVMLDSYARHWELWWLDLVCACNKESDPANVCDSRRTKSIEGAKPGLG